MRKTTESEMTSFFQSQRMRLADLEMRARFTDELCWPDIKARFSDFVLRQIRSAEVLAKKASEGESLPDGEQWARIVDLEMLSYSGAEWPQGIRRIPAPAAECRLFPQALPRLRNHMLWLRNQETLYGVASTVLTSGRSVRVKNQ